MRIIGFDCETYPIGQQPPVWKGKAKVTTNPVPKMVCMTSHDGNRTELLRGSKAVEQFMYWLKHDNIHLVAHNTSFDMLVMVRACWDWKGVDILPKVFEVYEAGRIHDTMFRQRMIGIAKRWDGMFSYGLDACVKKHFDVDISDSKKEGWRLKYNQLDPYPTRKWPQEAIDYAEQDAVWAYEIFQKQISDMPQADDFAPMLEQDGYSIRNATFQTMSDFSANLMAAWGMRVDIEWARKLDREYEELQKGLMVELKACGLMREDGTLDKEQQQNVFARAWKLVGEVPTEENRGMTAPSKTYPEGQIATNKHARGALLDRGMSWVLNEDGSEPPLYDPRFRLLMLWTKLSTFRSTYVEPMLLAHPYAVCTSYGLADSGRFTSSRPNLQNLPKHDQKNVPFKASDIRRAFVPRDGNVFINADYSTLELRTLAQVCLNMGIRSEMAEALRAGRDLHLDFAVQLMGDLSYEEAEKILKDPNHPQFKRVKKNRNVAKVANFGFPGGLGPRGFVLYARSFGISVSILEAETLKEAWETRWPEMVDFFRHIRSKNNGKAFIIYQDGPYRGQVPWRIRACKEGFPSACNTKFQGMAADGVRFALWMICKACYVDKDSPLYGFRPCVSVHDEFQVEGPIERRTEAAKELVRLMKKGMEIMVPDLPIEVPPAAAARRWDVDMEASFDENGELEIYEDTLEAA